MNFKSRKKNGAGADKPRIRAAALFGCLILVFCQASPVLSKPQISKKAQPAGAGHKAVLTWIAPTTKTDGSLLQDLAGYIIYYGPRPGEYAAKIKIPLDTKRLSCNGGKKDQSQEQKTITECRYVIHDLEKANRYFAVKAYDRSGIESDFSNEIKKK